MTKSEQHDPADGPRRSACSLGQLDPTEASVPLLQHLDLRVAAVDRATAGHEPAGPSRSAGGTVLDRFACTVAGRPDARALVDAERSFTYEVLDEVVTTAAGGLVAFGVRRGDRVAVALSRRADAVVLILAALRAGAVAVPVDVTYLDDRIAQILLDADARLLVTDDERAGSLLAVLRDHDGDSRERPWEVCCAEDVVGAVGGELPAAPSPDDVAYLVYTSGTTGTSSGVEVPHSALVTVLAQHEDMLATPVRAPSRHDGGARVAHPLDLSGVGFDAAWDPILWLAAGTTLCTSDGGTEAHDRAGAGPSARRRTGARR